MGGTPNVSITMLKMYIDLSVTSKPDPATMQVVATRRYASFSISSLWILAKNSGPTRIPTNAFNTLNTCSTCLSVLIMNHMRVQAKRVRMEARATQVCSAEGSEARGGAREPIPAL